LSRKSAIRQSTGERILPFLRAGFNNPEETPVSSDFRGPYTPEVAPSFRGGPSDELRRSANLRRQGPAGAPGANDDPPTQPQADPFSPDPIRCHEVLVSSARRARRRRDVAGTSPGRRPGQPSRHNSPRPENAQFGVARPALAILGCRGCTFSGPDGFGGPSSRGAAPGGWRRGAFGACSGPRDARTRRARFRH